MIAIALSQWVMRTIKGCKTFCAARNFGVPLSWVIRGGAAGGSTEKGYIRRQPSRKCFGLSFRCSRRMLANLNARRSRPQPRARGRAPAFAGRPAGAAGVLLAGSIDRRVRRGPTGYRGRSERQNRPSAAEPKIELRRLLAASAARFLLLV